VLICNRAEGTEKSIQGVNLLWHWTAFWRPKTDFPAKFTAFPGIPGTGKDNFWPPPGIF
jgi:hypothetical protein